MKLLTLGIAGFGLLTVSSCSSTETLTATELAEQAQAVCVDATEEFKTVVDDLIGSDITSDEEAAQFILEAMTESVTNLMAGLEVLVPPSELKNDYEEFIKAGNGALAEISEMSGEQMMASEDNPFEEFNATGDKLNLNECEY